MASSIGMIRFYALRRSFRPYPDFLLDVGQGLCAPAFRTGLPFSGADCALPYLQYNTPSGFVNGSSIQFFFKFQLFKLDRGPDCPLIRQNPDANSGQIDPKPESGYNPFRFCDPDHRPAGNNVMDWTVYILRCADGSLYTGMARDAARRVKEHNNNDVLGARYTRGRRPVRLVYQERQATRSQAARREGEIKGLRRSQKEALIRGGGK
jgi:putative endonuclease